MIPRDILETADTMGFDSVEKMTLTDGETVYILIGDGKIGLPMYLHHVDGVATLSTYEESMRLLEEPEYIGGDD